MGPRAALSYCLDSSTSLHKPDERSARNILDHIVPNARKLAQTDQELRAVEWVEAVAGLAIGPSQSSDIESRQMFVARLENMQANGNHWLTVTAVLALLNDCDMLASRQISAPQGAA